MLADFFQAAFYIRFPLLAKVGNQQDWNQSAAVSVVGVYRVDHCSVLVQIAGPSCGVIRVVFGSP